MVLFIKITLIITLFAIVYQDIAERQVYWFLFPLTALCFGILHYKEVQVELLYASTIINLVVVLTVLISIYIYIKIKLRTTFNKAFGVGDVLFFLAITFSFSSISFIVLFIGALIFSLLLHLFISHKSNISVPLAGYMSLFFGFICISYWSGLFPDLYHI